MPPATPSRVTTVPSRTAAGARASMLALFPAAMVCGFGLGLAGLAGLAPPPLALPLPPPGAAGPQASPTPDLTLTPASWAPVFGTLPAAEPAPEAPVAEPEPPYEPADDFDPSIYTLRGLATGDSEAEAFALLETQDGGVMVHVGDLLPEGYEVLEITPDGVVIDVFGDPQLIGFSEDAGSVDGDFYDGTLQQPDEGPSRDRGPSRREGLAPERSRYPFDYPGDGPADTPPRPNRFAVSR